MLIRDFSRTTSLALYDAEYNNSNIGNPPIMRILEQIEIALFGKPHLLGTKFYDLTKSPLTLRDKWQSF